jgi:hypothetical protein
MSLVITSAAAQQQRHTSSSTAELTPQLILLLSLFWYAGVADTAGRMVSASGSCRLQSIAPAAALSSAAAQ